MNASAKKRPIAVAAAIVLLAMGGCCLVPMLSGDAFGGGEQVGVIEVLGAITDSKDVVANLRTFADDDAIKGVVVRIDSPGGSVAPSQEIMQAVRATAEKKPLAVSMGSTAASGGYYIAIGAPKIFANAGSITGSIGVITQIIGVHKVLETVDVDVNTFTTGKYKDTGSPFRELTSDDEAHFRGLIDDLYGQFVDDIANARDLDVSDVRKLADGRVFTGRQAKQYNLIDEVGSFQDAVDWVAAEATIDDRPTLVYPARKRASILDELVRGGVTRFVGEVRDAVAPVVEYRYTGPQ